MGPYTIMEKETENVSKKLIKVYALPHRKDKLQQEAERIGVSLSSFMLMCASYWMQANKRDSEN